MHKLCSPWSNEKDVAKAHLTSIPAKERIIKPKRTGRDLCAQCAQNKRAMVASSSISHHTANRNERGGGRPTRTSQMRRDREGVVLRFRIRKLRRTRPQLASRWATPRLSSVSPTKTAPMDSGIQGPVHVASNAAIDLYIG